MKLLYQDGSEVKAGDVIRWHCWDSDDYVTWKFTGIVRKDCVIYLGGGCDAGLAIGKPIAFDEVIAESENNEPYESGIFKVGSSLELSIFIGSMTKDYLTQKQKSV